MSRSLYKMSERVESEYDGLLINDQNNRFECITEYETVNYLYQLLHVTA